VEEKVVVEELVHKDNVGVLVDRRGIGKTEQSELEPPESVAQDQLVRSSIYDAYKRTGHEETFMFDRQVVSEQPQTHVVERGLAEGKSSDFLGTFRGKNNGLFESRIRAGAPPNLPSSDSNSNSIQLRPIHDNESLTGPAPPMPWRRLPESEKDKSFMIEKRAAI
jgi:hypothetical protein